MPAIASLCTVNEVIKDDHRLSYQLCPASHRLTGPPIFEFAKGLDTLFSVWVSSAYRPFRHQTVCWLEA